MDIKDRARNILGSMPSYSDEALKKALLKLKVQKKEAEAWLEAPGPRPYYRQLLYADERVELLVMNWADIECAPHDHGDSTGWIQVLSGTTRHTIFKVEKGHLPKAVFSETKKEGVLLFAPRHGVHKMGRAGTNPLITLHLYSPPIRGMKVYDLKKCAACIVSSDCGAWWPEETRQKIKEIRLKHFH
ncbi:MAG: cysteine dioxygenase family protein [Halobacillus sp.]|uniref:cysteine dioxygenase n=1 Tax=Halobacillus sp. TaxID=56800 RepID=UPI003BB091CB